MVDLFKRGLAEILENKARRARHPFDKSEDNSDEKNGSYRKKRIKGILSKVPPTERPLFLPFTERIFAFNLEYSGKILNHSSF